MHGTALNRRIPHIASPVRLLTLLVCLLIAASPTPAQTAATADTASARSELPLIRRADAARTRGAGPGGSIDTTRPTLHEFVDYACPDCREFTRTRGDSLRVLATQERINVVSHVAPIPRLLRGTRAAEAALCAGGLGGAAAYDAVHERLFQSQDAWRNRADGTVFFIDAARAARVDSSAFRRCLTLGSTMPLVMSDLRLAGLMAIEGTPTIILSPPGSTDVGVRVVGEPSMLRITQATRDAAATAAPSLTAATMLGRWVVDSIDTFVWRAPVTDSIATELRTSRATVARTMAELRSRRLIIETTYSPDLTYVHRLRRAGKIVYEEPGAWAVPGASERLSAMTRLGTGGTYDQSRLIGRAGDRLVLERHFSTGASAGFGERVFLRADSSRAGISGPGAP